MPGGLADRLLCTPEVRGGWEGSHVGVIIPSLPRPSHSDEETAVKP